MHIQEALESPKRGFAIGLALEGETPLFDTIEEVAVTSISTMRQRSSLAPRLVLIQPNACSIRLRMRELTA